LAEKEALREEDGHSSFPGHEEPGDEDRERDHCDHDQPLISNCLDHGVLPVCLMWRLADV